MKPSVIRILWLVYFLCLVPASVTLAHRMQFDREFRSVGIVADYFQLLELAQTENVPIDDILGRVHDEAGITNLALMEDTPQFLAQRGLCTIVEGVGWPNWLGPGERKILERYHGRKPAETDAPSNNWPLLLGLPQDSTHLIITDPEVYKRIGRVGKERYGRLVTLSDGGESGGIVSLSGEPKLILEWGFGFDPVLVKKLRDRGFGLYPRLRDYPGYSRETDIAVLDDMARLFPDGWIVFEGISVLGSAGNLDAVSGKLVELSKAGWKGGICWVEFAEQKGDHSLAWKLPQMTARLHSIEDAEMQEVTPGGAVARFLRAVRERAVRIVFLKPLLVPVDQQDRVDKSIKMFADTKKAIESHGFIIGKPSTIRNPVHSGLITRLAAMLLLGVGLILLIQETTGRVSPIPGVVLVIAVFAVCLGLGSLGLKAATLGISVVSPTLAIAWVVRKYESTVSARSGSRAPLPGALPLWLGAVAITVPGAIMISASLINQWTLLEIDGFSGVKIALYLPILLSLVLGVQLILPPEKRTLSSAVAWLLGVQVRVWHVLLGFIALVGLFIMLDRSGNFPVLSVADWEGKFRGWFETVLYARPRTKEAFIGHPALVLGLYLGLSNLGIRRPLMYAGLVIGSIALTSLTNTFCHIHTPVELSIYRTIAGAVIGGVIGIIAGAVILGIYKIVKRWMRI